MNTRSCSFATLVVLAVSLSCRSKPTEKFESELAAETEVGQVATNQIEQPLGYPLTGESKRASYAGLEKDLKDELAQIPPPRTKEQYAASRIPLDRMLDRRRDLLFSIPISPKAERDRDEMWSKLEQSTYSNDEQYRYTKNFLNAYSEAPQVEQLVMWELLRCRMDYWKMKPGGGAGLGEVGAHGILLKIEMAKLLFSALGIDKKELFDAFELKIRTANDEAESNAFRAEQEIERIHSEQAKVAELILERLWKLP